MNLPNDFWVKTAQFDEILTKFNNCHSLTNYKNISVVAKDSIGALKLITPPRIAVDVGSGAGFPAVFLAFVFKDCEFHLYEPMAKKSSFLSYLKVKLNLENIIVHNQKIELCTKFRADLITSRAVAKTKTIIELCSGFYDEKTQFLFYKGEDGINEIKDLLCDKKILKQNKRVYLLLEGVACG